jgi:hypothetical protein
VLVSFTVEDTLTIEEWKAERELFVKQFSVNTCSSCKRGTRFNLRIKSSNNNNVTWPWSQLKAMHFCLPVEGDGYKLDGEFDPGSG